MESAPLRISSSQSRSLNILPLGPRTSQRANLPRITVSENMRHLGLGDGGRGKQSFQFQKLGRKPSSNHEFSSRGNSFGLILERKGFAFSFCLFYYGFQGYVKLRECYEQRWGNVVIWEKRW